MNRFVLPLLCLLTNSLLSRVAFAQTVSKDTTGIHWTEGLSWEQILAKAKTENKFIFVDCYTTWCGPCKQMDKEVYTYNLYV